MAAHIEGPLYYETMGKAGPVIGFVHPNPMDQSCWIYQMAQFSSWYRCVSIDIPGYGRSPKAEPGLTVEDMAQACWEAIDNAYPGEPAILVGCSVGSLIVPHMYRLRPASSKALVVCGVGYHPEREFAYRCIERYQEQGLDYRWDFTFDDFSPAFRATPIARFFAEIFTQRNGAADLESIIHQFEALKVPDPEDIHSAIACPVLIQSGSEDNANRSVRVLKSRIPNAELKILHGAGHACQIEQPWLFNANMLDFLQRQGLFPGHLGTA